MARAIPIVLTKLCLGRDLFLIPQWTSPYGFFVAPTILTKRLFVQILGARYKRERVWMVAPNETKANALSLRRADIMAA
jgi:hypothetical protein